MASLESHAASLQDQLIPGLDYRHGNSANYVQSRQNISIYPQGSNSYSASGTRTIRFHINADANWLDPASAMLYFTVRNLDQTAQTSTNITRMLPLGQAHIWFSRLRVLCQGQLVEQIDDMNRLYELMMRLSPPQNQIQHAGYGFGLASTAPGTFEDLRSVRRIPPNGGAKTVGMPILAGLFTQSRFLPVQYMNLVLEFSVADARDVCRGGSITEAGVTTTFTNDAYEISDCILKVDSITLDSQLQEEYAKKLLSSTLPISFKSFHHTSYSQTGDQDAVSIAMTRSVSRLCTVFVTFFSTSISPALNKECNYFPHTQGDINSVSPPDATHPRFAVDVSPDSFGVQYEFVIDGQRQPSTPCLTTVEAYASLVRGLGLAGQTSHSLGVTGRAYESNDCFVICENYEKVLGAAMSGKNLRGGSQLLLHLKGLKQPNMLDSDKITKVFIAIQHDCILELSAAGGVTLLE